VIGYIFVEIKSFLMVKAIVLFSGGVDSTVVAYICKLRGLDFTAVTFEADYIPKREIEYAKRIAKVLGFRHEVIRIDEIPQEFFTNTPERCYHCKRTMLKNIINIYGNCIIFDGTNKDDFKEFRPGLKANEEFDVVSPLKDLSKDEVRELARLLGLPNWNKPSNSCLATRIVGEKITPEKLKMVEMAEGIMHDLGFRIVRVRYEQENARIEVGKDEIGKVFELREIIVRELKKIGFKKIMLDLEGKTD